MSWTKLAEFLSEMNRKNCGSFCGISHEGTRLPPPTNMPYMNRRLFGLSLRCRTSPQMMDSMHALVDVTAFCWRSSAPNPNVTSDVAFYVAGLIPP